MQSSTVYVQRRWLTVQISKRAPYQSPKCACYFCSWNQLSVRCLLCLYSGEKHGHIHSLWELRCWSRKWRGTQQLTLWKWMQITECERRVLGGFFNRTGFTSGTLLWFLSTCLFKPSKCQVRTLQPFSTWAVCISNNLTKCRADPRSSYHWPFTRQGANLATCAEQHPYIAWAYWARRGNWLHSAVLFGDEAPQGADKKKKTMLSGLQFSICSSV